MTTPQFTPALVQTFENVASLIKKSKNIVLMPHAKMDCDGMSASVALHLILQKFGKHSTTVCSDPVPESFIFLPSSNIFTQELISTDPKNQKFSLSVNDSQKKFKNLEYLVEDGKINIILFSEESPFTESDFTFLGSQLKPDLIITLDSGDTFQLGKMYEDNKELFENTPVINIDHHESNTQFGNVNLVDHKSCSTTQLVYNLIHFLEKEFVHDNTEILDKDISTLLLAGMLTDTGSFQHSNTTPEALDIASILIDHGAEHQKIVKHLFKTKSLATLKIWGRVLTKLQNDPTYKIVWSSVSKNDLEETHSHSDDTNDLIDELMATTPDTDLVLLVKEREDSIISTSVRSSSNDVDSIAFTSIFGGGGHKQAAGFKIRERGGKSFEEIVSDIVYEAKKFQAKRLNIPLPKRYLTELIDTPVKKEESENLMPDFPREEDFEQFETEETQEIAINTEQTKQKEKTEEPAQKKHKKPKYTKAERDAYNAKKRAEFNNKQKEAQKNTQDLSEEEIPYAKHKEYFDMPTPEKYIEKQEDTNENYDDFADFLSKSDDDDEVTYLTESETAKIQTPSHNPFPVNNTEQQKPTDPFLESLQ